MRTALKETPFWRQTLGARVLCSALFLVGLAAFVVATAVDVDYWVSVARSDLSKLEYAGGSIIFRSVSFLFAAVVAYQWRRGTLSGRVMGGFAVLVLLSFASIGMSSVLGFGARERIVPYEQAKAAGDATQKAFDEAKARQLKIEDQAIADASKRKDRLFGFLEQQATGSKRIKTKQSAYDSLGQTTAVEAFTATVFTPPKIDAASDPQAEAIHKLMPSWSIEAIQLWTTAAFGIGLIVAEMVCTGFAVGMWPKAPLPLAMAVAPPGKRDDEDIPAEPLRPTAEIIHPAQFAVALGGGGIGGGPQAIDDLIEAPQPAQGDLLHADLAGHYEPKEVIRVFWDQKTRLDPRAKPVGATAMFRAYQKWCEDLDINPASQQLFGAVATKLGITKDTSSKNEWFYVGREVIADNGDSEPAYAAAA